MVCFVHGAYAQTDIPITRHWVYAPKVVAPEPVEQAESESEQSATTLEEDEELSKYSDHPYSLRRSGIRPHSPYIGPGPRLPIEDVLQSSLSFGNHEHSLLNVDISDLDTSKMLSSGEITKVELQKDKFLATGGVKIKLDIATFESPSLLALNSALF